MEAFGYNLIFHLKCFCFEILYIIKIYCNVNRRRPIFHNQGLQRDSCKGKERQGESNETEIEWIHNTRVNSPRYQRLDQPNFISTYTTIKIRRLKSFKTQSRLRFHGWGRILLLPETIRVKKNGIQPLNHRYWPIPLS